MGPDLDYAKVEFVAPVPPSVTAGEPNAINKDSTSNYCRFAHILMSLPLMDGFVYDFDLVAESGSGSSNRGHYQIILYAFWGY